MILGCITLCYGEASLYDNYRQMMGIYRSLHKSLCKDIT